MDPLLEGATDATVDLECRSHLLPSAKCTCSDVTLQTGICADTGSDMEQALQLAQEAGFHQAVVRAHYLAGNFLQALHCTIGVASPPGKLNYTLFLNS